MVRLYGRNYTCFRKIVLNLRANEPVIQNVVLLKDFLSPSKLFFVGIANSPNVNKVV